MLAVFLPSRRITYAFGSKENGILHHTRTSAVGTTWIGGIGEKGNWGEIKLERIEVMGKENGILHHTRTSAVGTTWIGGIGEKGNEKSQRKNALRNPQGVLCVY